LCKLTTSSIQAPQNAVTFNIELMGTLIFFDHRYYSFIAACIFARKGEWLENALVVPAISAFYAICLAALHNNGILFILNRCSAS
jgi:hypothetical protein